MPKIGKLFLKRAQKVGPLWKLKVSLLYFFLFNFKLPLEGWVFWAKIAEFFENPHIQTVIIMRLSICRLRAEFQPQDVSPTSGRLPGCSNTTHLVSGSTFEWKTLVLQSRSDSRRQAKCLPSLLSKVHLRFRSWRLQGVRLWRLSWKLKPFWHRYAPHSIMSMSTVIVAKK